jgi:hypothetical protein
VERSLRSRGPPGYPARRSIGFSPRTVTPHLDSAMEDLSAGWFAERGLCKLWIRDQNRHEDGAMRPPRVQFKMRGMLAAVASLALLMGGLRLLWLSSVYRKAAAAHVAHERLARILQKIVEDEGKDERDLKIAFGVRIEPESEAVKAKRVADARLNQRTAEYHAALGRKYEIAASRPWIPIAPDPPPPEPDVAASRPGPE